MVHSITNCNWYTWAWKSWKTEGESRPSKLQFCWLSRSSGSLATSLLFLREQSAAWLLRWVLENWPDKQSLKLPWKTISLHLSKELARDMINQIHSQNRQGKYSEKLTRVQESWWRCTSPTIRRMTLTVYICEEKKNADNLP